MTGWRARGLSYYRRGLRMAVRRVPAGLRSVAGLLLIVGGVFGFLPVLGFWMIPLGAAIIAVDVTLMRRRLARRRRRDGGRSR